MTGTPRARHRVLLVREWDTSMSGSGCCGRLSNDAVQTLADDAANPYGPVRADMRRVGAAYQALRERFADEELEITVVDPRNGIWLVPAIWRDARHRGLSAREALRQANAATAPCALVCDGLVLGVAASADPRAVVAAVEADLAAQV